MKQQIIHALPGDHPWQNQIYLYDVTDSTNKQAKLLAADGTPHGTVLIADRQTAGKGRLGRSFQSPAGMGIYMSVILRPQCRAEQLMHLTCATAVAMVDAVEASTGLRPGIKWTNDLVCGSKKLGGILTELSLDHQGNVSYAVIGIGINCCQKEGNFPEEIKDIATSLQICTHTAVDRAAVAAAMIVQLEKMSQNLSDPQYYLPRYRENCITLGQYVSVLRADEVRHGRALDVDASGALLVEFDDGHTETVNSGEVSVRGMYGYV